MINVIQQSVEFEKNYCKQPIQGKEKHVSSNSRLAQSLSHSNKACSKISFDDRSGLQLAGWFLSVGIGQANHVHLSTS